MTNLKHIQKAKDMIHLIYNSKTQTYQLVKGHSFQATILEAMISIIETFDPTHHRIALRLCENLNRARGLSLQAETVRSN